VTDDFLLWGHTVIATVADAVTSAIPGARSGSDSQLPDYRAVYAHVTDARIPHVGGLAVRHTCGRPLQRARGYGDAIGVALKQDTDDELDRGAWRPRSMSPFSWRTHIGDRCRATAGSATRRTARRCHYISMHAPGRPDRARVRTIVSRAT